MFRVTFCEILVKKNEVKYDTANSAVHAIVKGITEKIFQMGFRKDLFVRQLKKKTGKNTKKPVPISIISIIFV